jgi:hypothetical protein
MDRTLVSALDTLPQDRTLASELDALRSVNFDWTRQLRSVWRDPPYHVSSLHHALLSDLVDYFARKTFEPDPVDEPLGRLIVGPAGYGKTHLVGELRRRVWAIEGWFILLDFVGIKDFWTSVALGFLNSLQARMPDGKLQYDWLVLKIASLLDIHQEMTAIAKRRRKNPRQLATELAELFVQSLSRQHFQETGAHRNVVTALILLNSDDLDCHSVAHAWLQGMNLDPADAAPLGLFGDNEAIKVVQGLSWLMSLVGPTLIAVDQIDAIVSASNALGSAADNGARQEQQEAQSIVNTLAEGLMDLHEKKRRAVTVVSCLEATWKVLQDKTTVAVTDRYASPSSLHALPSCEVAKGLVAARLAQAYRSFGFDPPYPTWPFTEAALESAVGLSPRELLKLCDEHRQGCIAQDNVIECETFRGAEQWAEPGLPEMERFEQTYVDELKSATVDGLLESEGENQLRDLLDATLRLVAKHFDLPEDIEVLVQRDVDQKRPSLHGRLSFLFKDKGNREQHYCFLSLGHSNSFAFQSRLKAAMTASGIDQSLKFRHLFILRRGDPPGGAKTKALLDQFTKAGGTILNPTDDDLRALVALRVMADRNQPGFDVWLRTRKPLFQTACFKAAVLSLPLSEIRLCN